MMTVNKVFTVICIWQCVKLTIMGFLMEKEKCSEADSISEVMNSNQEKSNVHSLVGVLILSVLSRAHSEQHKSHLVVLKAKDNIE